MVRSRKSKTLGGWMRMTSGCRTVPRWRQREARWVTLVTHPRVFRRRARQYHGLCDGCHTFTCLTTRLGIQSLARLLPVTMNTSTAVYRRTSASRTLLSGAAVLLFLAG